MTLLETMRASRESQVASPKDSLSYSVPVIATVNDPSVHMSVYVFLELGDWLVETAEPVFLHCRRETNHSQILLEVLPQGSWIGSSAGLEPTANGSTYDFARSFMCSPNSPSYL